MLLSFKGRISANEQYSSLLELEKTARYLPQQKIYLTRSRSTSTESSNSFPALPSSPSRQKYLAVLADCLSEARCGSIVGSLNREPLQWCGPSLLGIVRRESRLKLNSKLQQGELL